MRHGTPVGGGFKVGDPVRVTSKKEHVDNAPGIITGYANMLIRVRLRIGTGTVIVFVPYKEIQKEEKKG